MPPNPETGVTAIRELFPLSRTEVSALIEASVTEPISLLLPSQQQRDTLNNRLSRNDSTPNGMISGNALSQLQSRARRAALPESVPLSAYCKSDVLSPPSKRPRLDPPLSSFLPYAAPIDSVDDVVLATQGQDMEGFASTSNLLAAQTQMEPSQATSTRDDFLTNHFLSSEPSPTVPSSGSSATKRPISPPSTNISLEAPPTLACVRFAPTGIEPLDSALGGGLRYGAISELVGPGSSGKTQAALTTIVRTLTLPGNEHVHAALIVSGGRAASARAVRRISHMVKARLGRKPQSSPRAKKADPPESGPNVSGVFRPQSPPPASGIFRVRRPGLSQSFVSSSDGELDDGTHDEADSDPGGTQGPDATIHTFSPLRSRRLDDAVAEVLARVHVSTSPYWPAFQSMIDHDLPNLSKSIPGHLGLVVLESLPVLAEVDEGSRESNNVQSRMERSKRLAFLSASLKKLCAAGPPRSGRLGLAVLVVNHVLDHGSSITQTELETEPKQGHLWDAPHFDTQNAHSTGEKVFQTAYHDRVVAQLGPVWSSSIHARLVIRRRPLRPSLVPRFHIAGDQEEYALSPERELGIAFCTWAPATAQGADLFTVQIDATGVHAITN